MKIRLALRAAACGSLALLAIGRGEAFAQAAGATYFPGVGGKSQSSAGHGEFTLSYQFSHFDGARTEPHIVDPVGVIDSHVIYPQIDYSLTDRFSMQVGVALLVNRYEGPRPHPNKLDDGSYHADFQDFQIGARYRLLDGPFMVEPFVLVTIPSHHYTTFAHAAVGRRLHKGEIGAQVSYYPSFDDYYVTTSLSHVFAEKPLGHNIEHWKASVEAGYYLKPNFAVRGIIFTEQGKGLSPPEDFPLGDMHLLDEHDRLFKANYTSVGAGFDWIMDENNRLSFTAFRNIQVEDWHILRYAFLLTLGHSF